MSSRLNPYVNYDGDARAAMEFYNGVFGGKLTISTFGEYGMGDGPVGDRVMHAQLETDNGFTLMASDTQPGMEHQPGNNISISLSGEDGDELHRYWDGLADGGNVTMPLEKQMWGDEFGMLVDRFGVAWMVDVVHPQTD